MRQQLRILLLALANSQGRPLSQGAPWLYLRFQLCTLLVAYGALSVGVWLAWPLLWATGGLLTGDLGSNLLGFLPVLLQLLAVGFIFTPLVDSMSDTRDAAIALRRAVAARDPVIAPAAPAESFAAMDDRGFSVALPDAPMTVAVPELLMMAPLAIFALFGLGALMVLIAAGMALAIPFGLRTPPARLFSDPGAVVLLIAAGSIAILGLLPLIAGWRWRQRHIWQRRGLAITLTTDGLSFHRPETPRRQRFIAWSAARSLVRISYKDNLTHLRVVYLLDAETETLLWEEPPTERYAPTEQRQAAEERQASARRLAALIAARTRQPLLDLSPMVTKLTQQTAGATSLAIFNSAYIDAIAEGDAAAATIFWQALDAQTQRRLRLVRWSPEVRMEARARAALTRYTTRQNATTARSAESRREWIRFALALLPYYPRSTDGAPAAPQHQRSLRRERRRKTFVRLLARIQLATLLAMLLVAGLAWLDNTYTNHVTHDLPQRVRQESPLYATSFRYPEDDWPIHTPTKTDTSTQAYVNGAYQITDSNSANSVMADTAAIIMRDGAEQVTVTERGKADENNLAWVGLALDVSADGARFTTFMVDELGDWSLSHYDGSLPADQQWSTPDAGQSDAVRQGAGATNTVLLIRKGDLYLLYVNDTLVDAYADRDHALTPGGYVGVYLDEGGYTARFTNFSVSPAPALLPFEAR